MPKRREEPTEIPPDPSASPGVHEDDPPAVDLPMMAASQFAEVGRTIAPVEVVEPRRVSRGVVVFDLDGTILDSIGLISHVAADVLLKAFGTPATEGRIHYLATTGMPFEAQLSQLYPEAPAPKRAEVASLFHTRKIQEAYAHATPFPEIPKVVKRLSMAGWTLVVSTGAEREMADLMLEREGLRYWFEEVLGSAQGTKREHLTEYRRRYPDVPVFLVGDSRFDMEAAASVAGVVPLARASSFHGWTLTPDDLKRWGAAWAEYSLTSLPEVVESMVKPKAPAKRRSAGRKSPRRAGSGSRRTR